MHRKVLPLLLAAVLLAVSVSGCGKGGESGKSITTGPIGVIKDEDYGHIFLDLTIDEFNAFGFSFGDSVDAAFDNGKTIEDIPYYSGYYCPAGDLLLCGYPGSPHVKLARNYGDGTWDEFGLTESAKVTVTLKEKGGYAEIEELNALDYSDDRENYDSDEAFANFREVRGGGLKEKGFYRSASPCDNHRNRAPYADDLAEENGIGFVLSLADDEEDYTSFAEAEDFQSDYYDALYRDGNVIFLSLNANYPSEEFARTIASALAEMTEHDGPCLIHCLEGKDRTGFACALILALAGADAQEITDDYMITYENYYGFTEKSDPERYEAVKENADGFLTCICGAEKGTPVDTLDLKAGAESYLRFGGLTDEQIVKIEEYIR